jgi:flagellar motor switch protein FliM
MMPIDEQTPHLVKPAECAFDALPAGKVEIVKRAFGEFLNRLAELLPAHLQTPCDVRFSSAGQRPSSAVSAEMDSAGCCVSLDLSPLPGKAYLVFGRGFVHTVLETLLGAPDGAASVPRQALTAIDLHLLRELIDVTVEELCQAWTLACDQSLHMVRGEIAVQMSLSESDDPSVLFLQAEVVLHGGTDHLSLVVPALLVRMAGEDGATAACLGAEAQKRALIQALDGAVLDVEAVLTGAGIHVDDVLRLKPGVVLGLPHKLGTPVECQVNGVSGLRGEMLQSGNSLVLELQSGPGLAPSAGD